MSCLLIRTTCSGLRLVVCLCMCATDHNGLKYKDLCDISIYIKNNPYILVYDGLKYKNLYNIVTNHNTVLKVSSIHKRECRRAVCARHTRDATNRNSLAPPQPSVELLQWAHSTVRSRTEGEAVFARWFDGQGQVSETHTFESLWQEAGRIAYELRVTWELAKGDRAILCYGFGLDFFAAFLGCLRSGVLAVPVCECSELRSVILLLWFDRKRMHATRSTFKCLWCCIPGITD